MPDWARRLRRALGARGAACDADVLEELCAHAASEYEALRVRGCDAAEAERQVEGLIDVWVRDAEHLRRRPRRQAAVSPPAVSPPPAGAAVLAGLFQDARYGVRLLRRQPGLAAVAILTMTLGIAATTVLFSIADGVLLRPLPWAGADRLMRVTETREGRAGRVAGTVSNGTFLSWRDNPSTIEDLGGWLTQTATLTGAGEPVRLGVIPTTPSLFPILGARPEIGRLFRDEEGSSGDTGRIILSHGLWQERFGGSPDVLGRLVQLDDKPYTVVGVMPQTFVFPDRETRAWTAWRVPGVVTDEGMLTGVIFRAIARLRHGATPAQAAAEATARARRAPDMGLAAQALFGAAGSIDVSVVPELQALTTEVRPAVLVLLAAAALLLITATANVASLQLARATTRRREVAVRAAIGAGQSRIVRQLLVENAVVGLCGGLGGVALAAALQRLLPSLLPDSFPRLDAVTLDVRVLSFALVVTVIASVACGLLPAWHTRRLSLVETLSEDGAASVGGTRRSPLARARAAIMSGQVAAACILLVGAGLLGRSLVSLINADRGYDPVNVLTARLPLPPGYPPVRRQQVLERLVERLHAVPGVTDAAYSTALPFVSSGGFIALRMRTPDRPDVDVDVQATQRVVSPGYFAVMRLHLVEGRLLSGADTATTTPAVVVNESFAREYLGAHPIGARIPHRGPRGGSLQFVNDAVDWEVVGVVRDMRQDDVEAPRQPEIFASFGQLVRDRLYRFDPILVARTVGDPLAQVATVRSLVHELAPSLVLDSVMSMEDRVMLSLETPRLYAIVLASFGACAVLVAGVGLFGVLSFGVAQRTREIGVRAALGAQARDVVGLVLRQAGAIVGVGIVLGLAAALAGARLLSTFLHGVSPYDGLTFIAVPIVILVVAAAACLVPAKRAAGIDPLRALRSG